jgi:hypothetical protein
LYINIYDVEKRANMNNHLTITSLVRTATTRSLLQPDSNKNNNNTQILVDQLMDCLGSDNISTPTNIRLESVVSLRKVVRAIRQQTHPVLCRLTPLLTSLKQLREKVAFAWKVTNASKQKIHALDSLPNQSITLKTISSAWKDIESCINNTHLIIMLKRGDDKTSSSLFEKAVMQNIEDEINVIHENCFQATAILAIMDAIIQTYKYTDPVKLQDAIDCACKCTNLLKYKIYPMWDTVLELGSGRLSEANDMLKQMRENINGVVDVATINATLTFVKQNRLGGHFVEKLKRISYELGLAKEATNNLLSLWRFRRNIGVSREMNLSPQHQPYSRTLALAGRFNRPVDELTENLARNSRLRDFVGLSNHKHTIYFCDAMLKTPGLSLQGGLDLSEV